MGFVLENTLSPIPKLKHSWGRGLGALGTHPLCESGLSEGLGLPRSIADQPWWSRVLLAAGSPCRGRADLMDDPPSLRNRLMHHLPAIGILAAEARAGGGCPGASGSLFRGPSPVLGGDPLHLPGSSLRHGMGACVLGVSQVAL